MRLEPACARPGHGPILFGTERMSTKRILMGDRHPSPANPAANRNWQEAAVADLRRLGISL